MTAPPAPEEVVGLLRPSAPRICALLGHLDRVSPPPQLERADTPPPLDTTAPSTSRFVASPSCTGDRRRDHAVPTRPVPQEVLR
jgi:hypothetical protein